MFRAPFPKGAEGEPLSRLYVLKLIAGLCLCAAIAVGLVLGLCAGLPAWACVLIAFAVYCIPTFLLWLTYRCPHCGNQLGYLRRWVTYMHCPFCGTHFDKER